MTAYKLVLTQATDPGLWFKAETADVEYLQQALRKLHAAVEKDEQVRIIYFPGGQQIGTRKCAEKLTGIGKWLIDGLHDQRHADTCQELLNLFFSE